MEMLQLAPSCDGLFELILQLRLQNAYEAGSHGGFLMWFPVFIYFNCHSRSFSTNVKLLALNFGSRIFQIDVTNHFNRD